MGLTRAFPTNITPGGESEVLTTYTGEVTWKLLVGSNLDPDAGIVITQTAFSPEGPDVGKVLKATGVGTVAWASDVSLTAPINPDDDGKVTIASGGDLSYLGGSAINNALIWNGTAWVSGTIALADANAVSGILGSTNGGTGLGSIGLSNEVLKVNSGGTALEYGKITSANIDPNAAITVSQIAAGGTGNVLLGGDVTNSWGPVPSTAISAGTDNTVLWSSGGAASWTGTPTVTSLAATSHLATGATPATVGAVRMSYQQAITSKDSGGSDVGVLDFGATVADRLTIGSDSIAIGYVRVGSSLALNIGAATVVSIVAAYPTVETPSLRFRTAGLLTPVDVASATGHAVVVSGGVAVTAGFNGGNATLQGGAPGAGGAYGTAFVISGTSQLLVNSGEIDFTVAGTRRALVDGASLRFQGATYISWDYNATVPLIHQATAPTGNGIAFKIRSQGSATGQAGDLKFATGANVSGIPYFRFYDNDTNELFSVGRAASTYTGFYAGASAASGFGFYANNPGQVWFAQVTQGSISLTTPYYSMGYGASTIVDFTETTTLTLRVHGRQTDNPTGSIVIYAGHALAGAATNLVGGDVEIYGGNRATAGATTDYGKVKLATNKGNVSLFGATLYGDGAGVLAVGTLLTAPTTSATNQALLYNSAGTLYFQGHTGVSARVGATSAGFSVTAGATSFATSTTTILYFDSSIVSVYKPIHLYSLATGLFQHDEYAGGPDIVIPPDFTLKAQNAKSASTGAYGIGGDLLLESGNPSTTGSAGDVRLRAGTALALRVGPGTATSYASAADGYALLWDTTSGAVWGKLSETAITPGTAYDVLQTNAAGTAAEWTDVVRHLRVSVGTADDANVTGLFQAADDTSGKYPLLARNASGYYHLYVSGEGVVGFGGGAAVNAVWIAYESGGYAFLREGTANGSLIESTANNARLRASGTGRAVLLEAPTTGGAIYSSVGPGYTPVQIVSESGVTISNRVAVGTSLDANVTGLFQAADDTSGKFALIARNSSGYGGIEVYGDGSVRLGGSATASPRWNAYFTGSDTVLSSITGAAVISAATVGAPVWLDAATAGGTVVSRVGTGFTAVHTVSESGVTISNYLAVGTTPDANVRVKVVGTGTTSATNQFAGYNSGGYYSFIARDDGLVAFGGAVARNATFTAYYEETFDNAIIAQTTAATSLYIENAYGNTVLKTTGASTSTWLEATGAGSTVQMIVGPTSQVAFFAGETYTAVRAGHTGTPLYLDAPTIGGVAAVRVEPTYNTIARFSDVQMDLYRQLAIQLDNSGGDGLRMYYWETSGTGPLLFGHKARGTAASPADIGQFDIGLSLAAYGWAGSQWNEMGHLFFRSSDTTPGAGDIATEMLIYMDPGGATASRLVLHSYPFGGEGGVYINDFGDGYVMASRITSGIGPDGNVRAYFRAEGTSAGKYSLICSNSSDNVTLIVPDDGTVLFGASLLSGWDFAWVASLYDDGFGYKESRLQAAGTDKHAIISVNGTGKIISLDALGTGAYVGVRVGPSFNPAVSFYDGATYHFQTNFFDFDTTEGDPSVYIRRWDSGSYAGASIQGYRARGTRASEADAIQFDQITRINSYVRAGGATTHVASAYWYNDDPTPAANDCRSAFVMDFDRGGGLGFTTGLITSYDGTSTYMKWDFQSSAVKAKYIQAGSGAYTDTAITMFTVGTTATSASRSLRAVNSSGIIHLDVYDHGEVKFGGSAAVSAVWGAYESSGYASLYEGTANGALITSGVGNMNVQATAAGKGVYLNAPTTNGAVYVRVGTGYTIAQSWIESATYIGVPEVQFLESISNATIRYAQRLGDAATKTLGIIGQAASSTSTGTNQNGGILLLYGGSAYGSGVGGKVGIQGSSATNVTFFGADEATGGKGVITMYNATSLPSSSPTNTSTIYSTGGRPGWVTAAGDDIEWVSTSSTSASAGTHAFPDTIEEFLLIRYKGNLRKIPLFAD